MFPVDIMMTHNLNIIMDIAYFPFFFGLTDVEKGGIYDDSPKALKVYQNE